MSYLNRLIHKLAIVTPTGTSEPDEYNLPVPGEPDVALVRGLIQPKSAREMADMASAGTELSDHRIFLPLMDEPANGAWISDNQDTPELGRRYHITGVEAFRFGRSPHLEVDARLIRSVPALAEGS